MIIDTWASGTSSDFIRGRNELQNVRQENEGVYRCRLTHSDMPPVNREVELRITGE